MRFGNSFGMFRRGLVIMFLGGLALDGLLIAAVLAQHRLVTDWALLATLPIVFPAFFLLVVSPTLLFSIHIGGGRIRHLLLDRYPLTDLPVADYEDMLLPRPRRGVARLIAQRAGFTSADFDAAGPAWWAATLYFRHGRNIRFFGAQMRILRSLKDALAAAKGEVHAGKLSGAEMN